MDKRDPRALFMVMKGSVIEHVSVVNARLDKHLHLALPKIQHELEWDGLHTWLRVSVGPSTVAEPGPADSKKGSSVDSADIP